MERFGYLVLDGSQWGIEIEFCDGHKLFKSGGSNSYPYNFVILGKASAMVGAFYYN